LSTGQSCSFTIAGRPRLDPPLRVAVRRLRSSDTNRTYTSEIRFYQHSSLARLICEAQSEALVEVRFLLRVSGLQDADEIAAAVGPRADLDRGRRGPGSWGSLQSGPSSDPSSDPASVTPSDHQRSPQNRANPQVGRPEGSCVYWSDSCTCVYKYTRVHSSSHQHLGSPHSRFESCPAHFVGQRT